MIADGVTGYVVAGHDAADFSERLLRVLGDPTGARRMGEAGVQQALRFSWDATAAESLSVYRELAPVPIPASR